MSILEQDLKGAKTVINKPFSKIQFTKYSRIYPFTNEDLIGCFNGFDFNNKKCLTVLGSSDQALDMYLRGASEITTFDINVLTKYYFYLKRAAILSNLTKEEYIEFFYYDNDLSYYHKIFAKIATNLSYDNLIFWTNIFNSYKHKRLFYNTNSHITLKEKIKYLNDDNYYRLKEKIKDIEINFMNTDVKNLAKSISEKYDFIYLSNIMYYVQSIYNKSMPDSLEEYKKLVFELANNLNEDGCMIICYFYYTATLSKKIFTEENFNFKSFGEYREGSILQYTKTPSTKF